MCGALDVADYILQEKGRLTAFQLQKLLYYCKASTTAMTSIAACPCPVVPVNGCNRSPTFN